MEEKIQNEMEIGACTVCIGIRALDIHNIRPW